MLPRRLRFSLSLLQLAALATLVRSVALDRWITVVASLLLLTAAIAAMRGRTWGVALSFSVGVLFAGVWALGVAPMWLALVGLLAARPFLRLFRHFLRFDRGAAGTLAVVAAGLGGLGALAWKEFALDLFRAFPILTPSAYPHHGVAVLAILAAAAIAGRLVPGLRRERTHDEPATTSVRIAEPTRARVGTNDDPGAALEELDAEVETTLPRARHLT